MDQDARKLVLVYPVNDLAAAKALFTLWLGTEPYADTPYYVGFRAGTIEIGLNPNAKGVSGPIAYWAAEDIKAHLQKLLDGGAALGQDVTDVGGGAQTALVKDADGNVLGLVG